MTAQGPEEPHERPDSGPDAAGSPGDPASSDRFAEEAACLPFEEALGRLEAVIDRIEAGKIGLEDSLMEYERGMALIRRCRQVLTGAERRIQTLTRDADGGLTEAPLDDRDGGA